MFFDLKLVREYEAEWFDVPPLCAMGNIITGSAKDMQQSDKARFYNHDKDGFSAERNKAIIEQTITDYEAMRAKKAREYDDAYGERSEAVISYLKALDKGGAISAGGQHNMMQYFGKRHLAYLQGLEIKQKLMAGMRVINRGKE